MKTLGELLLFVAVAALVAYGLSKTQAGAELFFRVKGSSESVGNV